MSMTQFFVGGLARWVACGGMTQARYEQDGNKMPNAQDRWSEGIALLRRWATTRGWTQHKDPSGNEASH